MELRVAGLSQAELDSIDRRAAAEGMKRPEYVRWLVSAAQDEPMTQAELDGLLALKARRGSIRAMELLALRMHPEPADDGEDGVPEPEPAVEPESFTTAVDELAKRRQREA
jgi:hypothetical protein